jgi:hypothetical protein
MRRRGARAPDISKVIASRRGDPLLCDLVLEFFAERDLDEHERAFTTSYVSNPRAGEVVKGHAIVLAELGLSPYRGKSVRAPDTFRGDWSKEKRSDHLLWRLAVSGAVWALAGTNPVTVYRGAAADSDFTATAPSSFVSGTLSREVAEEHFAGGPTTKVAYLWRQTVSADRVLMSFVETAAMNQHFAEGEIVLLAECGDAARWPLGTRHGLATPSG